MYLTNATIRAVESLGGTVDTSDSLLLEQIRLLSQARLRRSLTLVHSKKSTRSSWKPFAASNDAESQRKDSEAMV